MHRAESVPCPPTTLRALVAGGVAGAAGTVAMDAFWYARHRRAGGSDGPLRWEFGGIDGWDDVSAPGQVGRRLLEGLLDRSVPDERAGTVQNLVHWGTGVLWGAQLGLVEGRRPRPRWTAGLVLGPVAWLTSYLALAPTGIYRPIWEYDGATLARDLGAHLVFGAGTGAVFAALVRPRGRRERATR